MLSKIFNYFDLISYSQAENEFFFPHCLESISGKVGTFATCKHLRDRRLWKVFAASDHVLNNVDGFFIFDGEIALR